MWDMTRLHACDMIRWYVWHAFSHSEVIAWNERESCVIWLVYMCDMTRLHVWHDSFTCVTWLIYMCDMTRLHAGDMTRWYVWHDSLICVTWLIDMCDMHLAILKWSPRTRGNNHVTWLIHLCDVTDLKDRAYPRLERFRALRGTHTVWLAQLLRPMTLCLRLVCSSVLQCVAVCCSVLQCVVITTPAHWHTVWFARLLRHMSSSSFTFV